MNQREQELKNEEKALYYELDHPSKMLHSRKDIERRLEEIDEEITKIWADEKQ